jgi:rsbT co-antagonist protein RsbR
MWFGVYCKWQADHRLTPAEIAGAAWRKLMQQPDEEAISDSTYFQQFLWWLICIGGMVGALELILGLALAVPFLGVIGALTLCVVAVAVWSRTLVVRGMIQTAVLILCASFLIVVVVAVGLMPLLLPALLLAVLMTVALALPYLDRRALARLTGIAGLVGVVGVVIAQTVTLPGQPALPPWIASGLLILATSVILALTLLLLWQFSSRLRATLIQAQEANAALLMAQTGLETQVADRTAALHTALAELKTRADAQAELLAALEQERNTVRELSVPVIPISATTLIMPLIGALDTGRLQQLQTQALNALERSDAQTIIFDITGVPVVDTQVAQGLLQVVAAARLLGAEVALVGIRPEVAQALVGLGVDMRDIRTFSDLQSALGAPGDHRWVVE